MKACALVGIALLPVAECMVVPPAALSLASMDHSARVDTSELEAYIAADERPHHRSSQGNMLADISEKLEIIDRVVLTVDQLVQLVNKTTGDALSLAIDTSKGLSNAIFDTRRVGNAFDELLGEVVVSSSTKLLERLSFALTVLPEQMQDSRGRMRFILDDSVREFREAGYHCRRAYVDAALEVRRTLSPENAALIQDRAEVHRRDGGRETENHAHGDMQNAKHELNAAVNSSNQGIFDWWGSPSQCDQAKGMIAKADGTVQHMSKMLHALNTSLCSNIMEASVVHVRDNMQSLKSEMDHGAAASPEMPSNLIATLSDSIESTCNLISDEMDRRVQVAEQAVWSKLEQAQDDLILLRAASTTLVEHVERKCSQRPEQKPFEEDVSSEIA